ncbi:MAG: exodeoxyribonuclease VII small subunit [Oligoflexales bacterium]
MSEEQIRESQTYQGMINRVEEIIQNISSADCDLDTMVEKVEEGYLLIKNLKDRLNTTKDKIEKLQLDFEQEDSETED